MALDRINYLIDVTQVKAPSANDDALDSQPKPTTEQTTSFETYAKAISGSVVPSKPKPSPSLATAEFDVTQIVDAIVRALGNALARSARLG